MHTWGIAALLLLVTWLVLAGIPGSPVKGLNRVILGVGCIVTVLGFFLLAQGPADNPLSRTWAAIFLVLGYCAIIPLALLRRQSDNSKPTNNSKAKA